jgi:hypothetical protein
MKSAVETPSERITIDMASSTPSPSSQEEARELKLWLWRNFVDGRPEYWAFDNPFPCHEGGDPMTLGQPCGWAFLKQSTNGRPDVPDSEVERAMQAARPTPGLGDVDELVEKAAKAFFAVTAIQVGRDPNGFEQLSPKSRELALEATRAALEATGLIALRAALDKKD